MPREYRTSPEGPSPSPMSFGASDLNLQTPVYRPQMNVDMGVNVFEQLQSILGLGVQAASGIMDLQTQQIKQKINYDNAVQEVQNQRRVAEERAQSRQIAIMRETAEAGGDMAGVVNARTAAIVAGLPEQISAGTASIRALETERGKQAYDQQMSFEAKTISRLEIMSRDGDIDGVDGIRRGLLEQAEITDDPRLKKMYVDLAVKAGSEMDSMESRAESDNKKLIDASVSAFKANAEPKIDSIMDGLSADPQIIQALSGSSPESVRRALFDHVTERLSEDAVMREAMKSGLPEEQGALNAMIYQKIDSMADKIIEIRATAARNREDQIFRSALIGMAEQGKVDNAIYVVDEKFQNGEWSDEKRNTVKRQVVRAAVEAKTSNMDRMRTAASLAESSDPVISSAAVTAIDGVNRRIMSEVGTIRQEIDKPSPDETSPTSVGWTRLFPDKNSLIKWLVEERLGTNYEAYTANPDILNRSASVIDTVGRQWDADVEKSRVMSDRVDKASSQDINARFKSSPFGKAIASGNIQALQDEAMVGQAIFSASGGNLDAVPADDLVKAIKENVGNPEYFTMIKSFWGLYRPGASGSMQVMLANDQALRESWALGQYLNYYSTSGETDPTTLQTSAIQFVQNLKMYSDPAKRSELGIARVKEIEDTAKALLQGLEFEGDSFWSWDDIDLNVSTAFANMEAADRETMFNYAEIAASIPNASDRSAIMKKMMMSDGWQIVPIDGGKGANLIRNVYIDQDGNSRMVLPDNQTMIEDDWNRYVRSKIEDARRILSSKPTAEGVSNPLSSGKLNIQLNPLDSDLARGKCAIKVTTEGGVTYTIGSDALSVSKKDYEDNWKKLDQAEKMKRSQADIYESDFPAYGLIGAAAVMLGSG